MSPRACGCTPGACVTCAPRGCPCHDLVTALGREPTIGEIAASLPAPPFRFPPPAPTVTFAPVVSVRKRPPRRKAAA